MRDLKLALKVCKVKIKKQTELQTTDKEYFLESCSDFNPLNMENKMRISISRLPTWD